MLGRSLFVLLVLTACSKAGDNVAADSSRKDVASIGAGAVVGPPVEMQASAPIVATAAPPPPMRDAAREEGRLTRTDAVSMLQMPATAAIASGEVNATMLIRTGVAELTVDSLDIGISKVQALATQVGGWVGNTVVTTTGPTHTATLELRVPSTRWNDALGGVRAIGKVERIEVTAQDVGEEFVDVEARKANAKRLEARLIELLANRTGKLSDVVAVEMKLAQVREEIERLEGRSRYLRERASVSTLSLTVHEPYPLVAPTGTPSVIAEAARQAWRNFIGLIAAVIASLGIIGPIAVLGAVGVLAWRKFGRRLVIQEG